MSEANTVEERTSASTAFMVGRSLIDVAWNRRGHIVLGVVVCVVVGFLYYFQATRIYQSKSQMLVVKKRPDTVTGIDTRNLAIEDYVATHKVLIESPEIIVRAIRSGSVKNDKKPLNQLESLQGKDDDELTDFIRKNLTVSRNRSGGATVTNVLDLAYRGTVPEDTPIVLDAIMENYKKYLDDKYRNISEETLQLVENARKLLQDDLRKREDAYRIFRDDAPVLLVRGKDGISLTQDRLLGIEKKRTSLLVRKAELQGYLRALEARDAKQSPEALLAMVAEWSNRQEGDTFRSERLTLHNQLYPLLMEEQKLLQTRGENHPEVENMRKRIQVARLYLASPSGPWRKMLEKQGDKEESADPVDLFREYFKQQLNHVEVSEKLLAEMYKEEFDAAKALSAYERKDEQFRMDIERSQKLLDTIIKRLQEVDLIKDVGGYDANTIAPATIGKKVQPSLLLVLAFSLLAGGLVGFGLAYTAEFMDKTFRSVEEVRQTLGLPVVGQIPYLKPEVATAATTPADAKSPALAPILVTHHHPKSVEAESYRGIRTALYFNIHGKGHKVVQVTSPTTGDGKSTMAANVAISIAQSKKRVLLIDADMRRPTIHKLFGISMDTGLSSVIIEEVEAKDAIQDTAIPGLSVLPCGPIPPNPAELLTSPRFEEFLNYMREQYDFVVVDTPPLLAVTDPSVVAHKVDGVFLNIRFSKNGRPEAQRAREILHNLKANVIGVVVNDAEHVMGSYGYGYGYGYGNGYLDPAKAEVKAPAEQAKTS